MPSRAELDDRARSSNGLSSAVDQHRAPVLVRPRWPGEEFIAPGLPPQQARGLGFWQDRSSRLLTDEDAREMSSNLCGVFTLLASWDLSDRREPKAGGGCQPGERRSKDLGASAGLTRRSEAASHRSQGRQEVPDGKKEARP